MYPMDMEWLLIRPMVQVYGPTEATQLVKMIHWPSIYTQVVGNHLCMITGPRCYG